MTIAFLEDERAGKATWAARAALAGLLALGVYGLFHPELRPQQQWVHASAVFTLTLAIALSFPRLRLRWIELLMIGVTCTVEVLQMFGLMVGLAQIDDVAADLIGTFAAALLVAGGRRWKQGEGGR